MRFLGKISGLTLVLYSGQHHRLQNFIDSAYILAEKTQEKIELLIVEWNPPANHRRVIDAFVRILLFL